MCDNDINISPLIFLTMRYNALLNAERPCSYCSGALFVAFSVPTIFYLIKSHPTRSSPLLSCSCILTSFILLLKRIILLVVFSEYPSKKL